MYETAAWMRPWAGALDRLVPGFAGCTQARWSPTTTRGRRCHRLVPVMASLGWAARLQAVFGVPVDRIEEEHLQSVVDAAVREASDLDFKKERYGNGESQRRELAADIAAFANDRGGVIVIGIRDENDVAVERTPVSLDSGEEGRIRSIAAGNVTPYAAFEIRVVKSSDQPGRGYYLLIVPPSPDRPHAVRKEHDLRYPRRDGTQKRWLSESEVADAYRDRFGRVTSDIDRLRRVMDDGLAAVEMDLHAPYLVVGLVPSQAGAFRVDAASVRRVEAWARSRPEIYGQGLFTAPFAGGVPPLADVAVRRVRLGAAGPAGVDTSYQCVELHSDGGVFVAGRMLFIGDGVAPARMPSDQPDRDERYLPVTGLTFWVAGCLRAAALLSAEVAGAFGDCITALEIWGPDSRLLEYSGDGLPVVVGRQPRTLPVRSAHTLALDALVTMGAELLVATRLVCAELVQGFGSPELSTISADGRLRLRAFPPPHHDQLRVWAEQTGQMLDL